MLSAVVQLLHGIQKEKTHDRKLAIIDLCSSAYPDVRPWQVAKSCRFTQKDRKLLTSSENEMNDLYYAYLSLLLHPQDGHDSARRDPELVKVSVFSVPIGV